MHLRGLIKFPTGANPQINFEINVMKLGLHRFWLLCNLPAVVIAGKLLLRVHFCIQECVRPFVVID